MQQQGGQHGPRAPRRSRGRALALALVKTVLLVALAVQAGAVRDDIPHHKAPLVFTNSFLVRLNGDLGNEVAHRVAQRNGFHNLGPVSSSVRQTCLRVPKIAELVAQPQACRP